MNPEAREYFTLLRGTLGKSWGPRHVLLTLFGEEAVLLGYNTEDTPLGSFF